MFSTTPKHDALARAEAQSEVWNMCGLCWAITMADTNAVQFRCALVSKPDEVHLLSGEGTGNSKKVALWGSAVCVHGRNVVADILYPLLHSALPSDERITLKIRITLFDVFDRDGRCVTDRYIGADAEIDAMQTWLQQQDDMRRLESIGVESTSDRFSGPMRRRTSSG